MLQGIKTYLVSLAIVTAVVARNLNYINDSVLEQSLYFLAAAALATLAAKINRLDNKIL